MPTWVGNAYAWSEELVFEADGTTALQHFYLADGSSLEQKLSRTVWEALNAVWPKAGPLANLCAVKPWAALITLPFLLIPTTEGVEPVLTARAKQDGKPIHYLETMADFSALAEEIPDREYARVLAAVLVALPEIAQSVLDLHGAWLRGDGEALATILPRTILGRSPLVSSYALDRRNANWLPRILGKRRTTKRTLIAVGALHLVGPAGLLSQLKAAGLEGRPL